MYTVGFAYEGNDRLKAASTPRTPNGTDYRFYAAQDAQALYETLTIIRNDIKGTISDTMGAAISLNPEGIEVKSAVTDYDKTLATAEGDTLTWTVDKNLNGTVTIEYFVKLKRDAATQPYGEGQRLYLNQNATFNYNYGGKEYEVEYPLPYDTIDAAALTINYLDELGEVIDEEKDWTQIDKATGNEGEFDLTLPAINSTRTVDGVVYNVVKVDPNELPAKGEIEPIQYVVNVTLSEAPHVHDETLTPVAGTEADCTNPGLKDYYVCSCGQAFTDEAGEHPIASLESWKTTAVADGGGMIPVDSTKHDWPADWTTAPDGKTATKVCGNNEEHVLTKHFKVEPDIGQPGLKEYTEGPGEGEYTDENGQPIEDFDKWSKQGGDGFIPAYEKADKVDPDYENYGTKEYYKDSNGDCYEEYDPETKQFSKKIDNIEAWLDDLAGGKLDKVKVSYTVTYQQDGVEIPGTAESGEGYVGDKAPVTDNCPSGYKPEGSTEFTPQKPDDGDNAFVINYVVDGTTYTVEHYLPDAEKPFATETGLSGTVGSTVGGSDKDYADKGGTLYAVDTDSVTPITLVEDSSKNVLKVTYKAVKVQTVPRVDPTLTKDGTKPYYYNPKTGKNYADPECTKEITNVSLWLQTDGEDGGLLHHYTTDELKPTYTSEGYKPYYYDPNTDTYYSGYDKDTNTLSGKIGDKDDLDAWIVDKGETGGWLDKLKVSYTVEYYDDGVLMEGKDDTGSDYAGEEVTPSDNCPEGHSAKEHDAFVLDAVETQTFKVEYLVNSYGYTVEHYFGSVKQDDLTDTGLTADYGDVIGDDDGDYTDKGGKLYVVDTEATEPITIGTDESKNVLKVIYKEATVEKTDRLDPKLNEDGHQPYYYNPKDETYYEDEECTKEIGDKSDLEKWLGEGGDGNIPGYEKVEQVDPSYTQYGTKEYYVDKTGGTPVYYESYDEETGKLSDPITDLETWKNDPDGGRIDKLKIGYTVEYYVDGVINNDLTETDGEDYVGETITKSDVANVDSKCPEGHKFEKLESSALTETEATNIVKVYYTKESYNYTVKYYFNDVEDPAKSQSGTKEYGSEITPDDYSTELLTLDTENTKTPFIIGTSGNDFKVYYVDANVTPYEGTQPTTKQPGQVTYYKNEKNGKYYTDAGCTQMIGDGSDTALNEWLEKPAKEGGGLLEQLVLLEKAADCTEDGYIKHIYNPNDGKYYHNTPLGRCGELIAENDTDIETWRTTDPKDDGGRVPATGHQNVTSHVVYPDCDKEGHAKYWHCETCGANATDKDFENLIEGDIEDWKKGDGFEPKTDHDWGEWTDNPDGSRTRVCDNYDSHTETCSEHSGGEANCIHGAFCETCGKEYTDKDSTKHVGDSETGVGMEYLPYVEAKCEKEGHNAVYQCECGLFFKDAACTQMIGDGSAAALVEWQKTEDETGDGSGYILPAHDHEWGDWEYADGTYHKRECIYGDKSEYKQHTGGTATCIAQAVCEDCETAYGNTDPTNHVHTRLINAEDADCENDGYTGDTYCDDCTSTVATGETIDKLNHDWGDWEPYDQINHISYCNNDPAHFRTEGHEDYLTFVEYISAEEPGGKGTMVYECSECGATVYKYEDLTIVPGVEPDCTNPGYMDCFKNSENVYYDADLNEIGDATAYAAWCGEDGDGYLEPLGHLWGAWYDDNGQHRHDCTRGDCEATEAFDHAGGTATCKDAAVCDDCHLSYGDKDPDNHVGG